MFRLRLVLLAIAIVLALGRIAVATDAPTLRIALAQEPGTLDPVVATLAVETDIDQFVFDGLTRYDDTGKQIPDLATVVPSRANGGISADGRTITYHLVHDARWHDGVPLTSADVAFTFAALKNPANNVSVTEPYAEMERVETPDPYTVRVILKYPWAPAIEGFTNKSGGAIVPAHLLQSLPNLNRADFNAAPIGSGPYKLVAWHRGSDMVFEANHTYFRGAPKIEHVVVRFLTNDNTMLVALRTGELDLADRLSISTYTQLGAIRGMVPALATQSQWEHLTFNLTHPPLDDVRVRRALCSALDVHELYAKVAHGLGELAPANQNPLTAWYNPRARYYPFDPAAARALLDRAGWKPGPDGVRVKNGRRLTLTLEFPAGNITRDQTGVILQQRWGAVGVETQIKTFPPSTFFAPGTGGPFYGGTFDVALSAWVNALADPSGVNENDPDRIPPHGNNVARYVNAQVGELEQRAASISDPARRKPLYDRIQLLIVRDVPYYTIRWSELTDMRSLALAGVKPPIFGSTFWNVAAWELRAP